MSRPTGRSNGADRDGDGDAGSVPAGGSMRRKKGDRQSGQDAEPRPDGTPAASARHGGLKPDDDDATRRLRLLAEHAPVGLFLTDAAGDCIYANPTWCADAGLTSEQALGRGWLLGLHEDDRQEIAERWYRTVSRGESWQLEYRFAAEDGRVTWVLGTAEPVRTPDGQLVGYAGMNLDITDLKYAEEAARAGEASLKHAQLLSEVGSWEWDVAAERLTWSDEMYRIFGVERGFPLTFESVSSLLSLEDRARNNDWVIEALKSEEPSEIELRIVRPDGEVRHVLQRAVVEHDESGEPVRAFGTIQDVTARKGAEAAARSSDARLAALLENADFAIWAVDAQGRLVVGNTAFHVSVRGGLGHDVRPGDPLVADDLPPEVADQWHAYYDRALSGERFSVEVPRRFTDLDGWMEYRFNPVTDLGGAVSGVMVIGRDVTERKRLEDELRQTQELLKQAEAITQAGGWSYDAASEEVTWTDEVYRIYGVDRDFDVSDIEAAESFYGAEGRDAIAAAFSRAVEQGEPYDLELPFVRADGERLWVRTSARPVIEDGAVVRVIGNIADITERKGAELALRESEERFRLLLSNANDAVYVHEAAGDGPGRFIEVNEQACRMLGYTREELLQMEVGAIDVPDQVDRHAAIMEQLYGTGSAIFETRHVAKDGHLVPVEVSTRLFDLRGTPTVLSVTRDISERLAAEQALRASEARYRDLLETLMEGIWALDAEARTTLVNPAMAAMLGYSVAEMDGRPLFDFMDDAAVESARELFARRSQGVAEQHEFEFRCKDGAPLFTRLATTPLMSADGSFRGAVAAVEDITARKAAEAALNESEARSRAVADFTYDWEYWQGEDGTLVYVSPSCERITGYAPEEFLADPDLLVRIIHPDDRETYLRHHDERLANSASEPCSLEFRIVHRSGETRWIGHACQLVVDEDGTSHGVRGSNRDITAHRQADEALRANEALLRGLWDAMPTGCAIYEVRNDGASGDDYIIRYFNRASLMIEDKTLDEVVGTSLRDLRPAIDDYGLIPVLQKVWQTGETAYYPSTLYVDEKFANYYENYVFKLPSGEIVAIYNDVTERERAVEALRESEERWRSLTETSPDHIVTIDRDLTIEFVNRASPGLTVDDLIGTPLWTYVEEEHRDDVKALHERVLQTGEPESYETVYPIPDGGPIYYESRCVPRRGPQNGAIIGLTVSARDITDRKRSEEALREAHERLSMAQLAADAGVWDWDMTTGTLNWSPEFFQLFGLPTDAEASFDTWRSVLHPDDIEAAEARIAAAAEQHVPLLNEYRIVHPDGAVRWIRAHGDTTCDDAGRPIRMSGICVDITDQRQAETQLRESEERFRTLVQNVPGMVFRCEADPPWQDIFVSEEIERLTGYPPEDSLSGKLHWPDIVLPEDLAELERTMEERRLAHKPHVVTYRIRHRDGGVRWVREMGRYAFDDQGRATHVDGVITDITDQVQAEEALRESEERFRGVFETSATGIVIADTADQRFLDANESFQRITGYSLDELRRLDIFDITHPDDRQREAELIAAYAAGEVPDYVIEKRYVRKDGEVRWVRLTGDALHLEPDRPPLAVATVEDITESKRADDALREAAERLHATLSDTIKAMGNIVELRDPYTAGHEREVTRLADAIAEEMGVDAATREGLVMAGEVHDLGKIAVPAEILSKPSALTEMEFSLVKQHPVVGRELMSSIQFERPVAQIVGQHHERLDGSGYPDGLTGDDILLEARILAVADVVEAMAAHRPYRPALGIEAALAEVRAGAGTLYDAVVVAACERVIAAGFAVGSG
jgi:PAS domain S-box-containing protein